MGALFLSREQDRTVFDLRTVDVPQKVEEDRAEVIRSMPTELAERV